jgi:hypothetical protein
MESHPGERPGWSRVNPHMGQHIQSYLGTGQPHDGGFILPVKPGDILLVGIEYPEKAIEVIGADPG